ncbi:MAG: type II secretion system protein GspK [Rhodanobacteraceae bacterium]
MSARRNMRGAALLFALWSIALLAALLAGLAVSARGEDEVARNAYDQARARYAAEAGVARAVEALRDGDPARRWVPDGRSYRFVFDRAQVEVRITDADGQVDLNAATPEVLLNLFRAAGVDEPRAQALSDAVQDWRDSDDLPRAHGAEADAYHRAGLAWTPRNGPFRTPDELTHVLGMDDALYRKLAGSITVYSGRNFPDGAYADPLALAASRDGDLAAAAVLVNARRARSAMQSGGESAPLPMVGVAPQPLTAGFGGLTQDIRVVATLPDGTRSAVDASLRLTAIGGGLRPYTVLGWNDLPNGLSGSP